MGPLRPQTWSLGGRPTVATDVPITAVYLFLYICGAITHMTIFQLNRRKGHKFLISGLMFGFCMARTTTCVIRIASTSKPNNIPLSLAASIFVQAGVVIVYVVNLNFAQRIVRAQHQRTGWHPLLRATIIGLYVLIVLTLIMLITTVVQSFYTLDTNTRSIDRSVQLYGVTAFAIISFLPILIIAISLIVPRRTRVDKFGSGRFRTKIIVLLLASTFVCAGASWRAATVWHKPVSIREPLPWYDSRAFFYIADFTMEILVIYLYAFVRFDMRFYVPNGARGPGSYRAGAVKEEEARQKQSLSTGFGIYTEEETFDEAEDTTSSMKTDEEKDVGFSGSDSQEHFARAPEFEPARPAPVATVNL